MKYSGSLKPDPSNGPPKIDYPPDEINQNDPREVWIITKQHLQPIAMENPMAAENVYQSLKPQLEKKLNTKFPMNMFVDWTK